MAKNTESIPVQEYISLYKRLETDITVSEEEEEDASC